MSQQYQKSNYGNKAAAPTVAPKAAAGEKTETTHYMVRMPDEDGQEKSFPKGVFIRTSNGSLLLSVLEPIPPGRYFVNERKPKA